MQRMLRLECLFLLWAVVTPVNAQVLYGTLVGNVTDPSQSAVAKAVVKAANSRTGLVRETVTDERGAYAFRDLVEGVYDLTVSAPGFNAYKQTSIDIRVNALARADVTLQLGAVTESVNVAATATPLQTDTADVRAEISTKAITNLPISGYRNYQTLLNLVPGSTPARFQNAITDTPARALTTNINGTARNTNNTRVDGATSVHTWLPHHVHYIPPAESIETVNISTNSFDAEQGLAGGAAVTVSTKSGTNSFHGAVFEFFDNHKFGARNFFFASPKTPKNLQNQYGGALGGRIIRDKLFFFASWEGLKQRQNFGSFATVPAAQLRSGDFSSVTALIYDPRTGGADGRNRTPFAENRIPENRQSAIARKIQALIPQPNQPGFSSNLFASAPLVFDRDSVDGKLNWNVSSRTTMFGKYSIMISPVSCRGMLGEAVGRCPVSGGGNSAGVGTGYNNTQVMGVGVNHTVTPSFLIDGNFGGTWMHHDTRGPDFGRNIGSEVLGIPGTNGSDIRQSGFPIIGVSSYETLGNPNTWSPVERNDRVYTYVANASWTKGAHNIRFGADIIKHQLNHWQPEQGAWSPRGGLFFTGGVTALNGGAAPNQFNSYAAFLLGLTNSHGKALQFYDPMRTREWQHGYYFRDQWQVSRNFTATLGLRWEYFPLMYRTGEIGIERYDPSTDRMLIGGLGNVPRNAGITTSKKMFAPRFGLAYRIGDKNVVRAGYGITYDPYPLSRPLRSPFPAVVRNEFSAPNSFAPSGSLETGIPDFPAFDVSSGVVELPKSIATSTMLGGLFRRGYIQSYNLMVQRQLPMGFSGQLGYVGTHSVRMGIHYFNLNAGIIPGAGNRGRPLNMLYGRAVDINGYIPMGNNTYNSLQFKLDRRFTGGFFLSTGYTYAKAMGITGGNIDSSVRIYIPEAFNRNRAVTDFDRTHNFQTGLLYELPFGKGKHWATGGAGGAILGGWQINSVFAAYSGNPFTVTASGASLDAPGNTQVADQVLPEVRKLGGAGVGQLFYDRAAYRSVTERRLGTSALNGLRGPGVVNLDLSVFRTFRLTERFNAQFRAESYNFANTPHFDNPNSSVESTNFMNITSALQDQRTVRFALRIGF